MELDTQRNNPCVIYTPGFFNDLNYTLYKQLFVRLRGQGTGRQKKPKIDLHDIGTRAIKQRF